MLITKRYTVLILGLWLGLATPLIPGEIYEIDKSHTEIGFKATHMAISRVSGQFTDYTASIEWDDKAVENSKVSAIIKADSLDTRHAKRDKHVKADDFLDVATYPEIRFTSTLIENDLYGGIIVHGNLTIKDVTKKVQFPVTQTPVIVDPWGNNRRGFEATLVINRQDYNVAFNNRLKNGSLMVGDDVEIHLHIEALQK